MADIVEDQQSQADLSLEIERLKQEVEDLRQEKNDLELLLETTLDHATEIENELQERNEQIERYIRALRRELQAGRKIQADFLPQTLPQIPGWEVAARFRPARDVAGDFYDAFTLPGNRIALVIADVCDKGVGAALFMSLVRTLLRVLSYQAFSRLQHLATNAESYLVRVPRPQGQPPVLLPAYTYEVLTAVSYTNDYIATYHGQANMFATLFYGVLDTETGALSYINGGHDAPIHLGPGGVRKRLTLTGPAVGLMADMAYTVNQIQLEPGEMLLAYTDGIPEARSSTDSFYGEEALLELITDASRPHLPSAGELLTQIENAVATHVGTADPSDDVTLLAIRREG